MATDNFFETALQSDRGAECIRLWANGASAAQAIEQAFGEGAVEHMARKVWLQVRLNQLAKQVAA